MLVLRKKQIIMLLALASQVVFSIAGALLLASIPRDNTIFPGVSVSGVEIGGLTKTEARNLLSRSLEEKIKHGFIELQYQDKKWKVAYADLGVTYDITGTLNDLTNREDDWFSLKRSIKMVSDTFKKPITPLRYDIDTVKLDKLLTDISSEVNVSAQNARICMYYGNLKILPATKGQIVNIIALREKIERALGTMAPRPLTLEVELHEPVIKSADLKEIKDSVGLGISRFSRSDTNRFDEINAVINRINGTLIQPGDEFSLNRALSSLEPKSGLKSSSGLNQVATTLYQAVLYSGFSVLERKSQAVQPAYAPAGQDAAVVPGKMDLRFKNTSKHPVYILAEINDNRLSINLLGVKEPGQTIQVFGKQESDSSASQRIRTKVYRVFYYNGVETKRELVSINEYIKPEK